MENDIYSHHNNDLNDVSYDQHTRKMSRSSTGWNWSETFSKALSQIEDIHHPIERRKSDIIGEKEKMNARQLIFVSNLPSLLHQSPSLSLSEHDVPYSTLSHSTSSISHSLDSNGHQYHLFNEHLSHTDVDSSTYFSDRRHFSVSHTDHWFQQTKDVLSFLGPGWLVAMAYVDPGNLEGDLVAGATRYTNDVNAGYRLLWVLVWATLIGFILQRLAIKLGTVTGKDLATICRLEFDKPIAISIWILTEICLIGADIQSVIGSAIGLQLLFHIPLSIGIIITLFDTFIVLLIDYYGTRKLEGCFAILISLMACCFFMNMYTSSPSLPAIINGLTVISIPKGSFPNAIALVGSVVMPHNFFLQSAVVQSRYIDRTSSNQILRISRVYTIETFGLLFISLCVNIAVIVAFANPKITLVNGESLTLYNAHRAIETAIGKHSALIWAMGLLAAGQCSTMACTYAGQFVMEGLLGLRIKNLWCRLFITRLVSIIPLIALLWFNKTTVEIIANCVNVMQAFNLPFVLILLLKLTSSESVMGQLFVLSLPSKIICYIAGGILISANMNLLISQLGGFSFITSIMLFSYLFILGLLWYRPVRCNYYNHCHSKNHHHHMSYHTDPSSLLTR